MPKKDKHPEPYRSYITIIGAAVLLMNLVPSSEDATAVLFWCWDLARTTRQPVTELLEKEINDIRANGFDPEKYKKRQAGAADGGE